MGLEHTNKNARNIKFIYAKQILLKECSFRCKDYFIVLYIKY